MSLPRAFQRRIRAVRIRCGANRILQQAGQVLAVAGVVAALAVLVDRLIAVHVLAPWGLWTFWVIVAGTVLALGLRKLPTKMQACLALDDRLGLRERFSTTLALAQSDDPFAAAARAESMDVVRQVDLRGHFPISLSRTWALGAGAWMVTLALVLLLPQKDLLGFLRDRQARQQKAHAVHQAQTEVRQTQESVKAAVRAMDDPNLTAELKRLDDLGRSTEPQEVRREAIKALGDLAEKIKQMQAASQVNTADVLQQMFKQLRGSPHPFSQQVRMALAKGDFAQAAKMLGQLQGQLSEGSLPEENRKELAAQTRELAKEIQKLSEQNRQAEEELAKLGLDKQLAQASPEKLREALLRQGLNPDAIKELMKKVEAGHAAGARCAGLGQALGAAGGAGGLSADDLSGIIDELNSLDALRQQAFALQASLAEISRSMGSLGQGLCQGNGQDLWRIGQGGGHGDGIGLSPGSHEITSEPLIANKLAKAPSRPESDKGPIVASWTFRDMQVKGEARRAFAEVVQAGRARAAEAVSENQIPRRYEDAVKAYFNQLEESVPKP